MKTKILHFFLFTIVSVLFLSCTSKIGGNGTSNGAGTGNTENDVAFNPTTSSDMQIYNYKALRQRFIDQFGLSPTSNTIVMLDAKKTAFLGKAYTSSFAKEWAAVVSTACGEISDTLAFPDGKSIAPIWKLLTHTDPTDNVKEMETSVITATAGETDDVTTFGMCFAAFTSPPAVFINYTSTEKI
jgi:hypothetical protein